jgi:hypothetical protein
MCLPNMKFGYFERTMKNLLLISLLLLSACANTPKQESITPQSFSYIDCMRINGNEQFCRDNASP